MIFLITVYHRFSNCLKTFDISQVLKIRRFVIYGMVSTGFLNVFKPALSPTSMQITMILSNCNILSARWNDIKL
jgi:hypothetical protein